MQLTPQKLSAARKNLPGAPGAGEWPEDQNIFSFLSILHIIQLTPHMLSAELKNLPGATGASAWPED